MLRAAMFHVYSNNVVVNVITDVIATVVVSTAAVAIVITV